LAPPARTLGPHGAAPARRRWSVGPGDLQCSSSAWLERNEECGRTLCLPRSLARRYAPQSPPSSLEAPLACGLLLCRG
jgi:hypothetical protein